MSASRTLIYLSCPRAMERLRALGQEERGRKLAEQESYLVSRMKQNAGMQSQESEKELEKAVNEQGESHSFVYLFDDHQMRN